MRYREPMRGDYDSAEEYEDDLAAYEIALDDYIEQCHEEHLMEKYGDI